MHLHAEDHGGEGPFPFDLFLDRTGGGEESNKGSEGRVTTESLSRADYFYLGIKKKKKIKR